MRKPPLYKSFQNAFRGILQMLQHERNFQIEVAALLTNLCLMQILNLNATDSAVILLVCFAVLAAELFNTVVEKLCDFVHPEFHVKIGLIKDMSAGAVTLLALAAVLVGLLIYPKYLQEFFT